MQILFNNQEIIVVNKPSGLNAHANDSKDENLLSLMEKSEKEPLHLLNRLDKETSGLSVFVRKPFVLKYQELWQSDFCKKFYLAVTHGPLKEPQMEWKWPLTDKSEGRQNPQGLGADRKACLTLVKEIKKNPYFSLIEAEIKSGRQHQIRKHAALNRTPLVGDKRYSEKRKLDIIQKKYDFEGLALHCYKLILTPELIFETQQGTEDFEQFFKNGPT